MSKKKLTSKDQKNPKILKKETMKNKMLYQNKKVNKSNKILKFINSTSNHRNHKAT